MLFAVNLPLFKKVSGMSLKYLVTSRGFLKLFVSALASFCWLCVKKTVHELIVKGVGGALQILMF